MGEHVVQKLDELQALDPTVHWFCPRSTPEDYEVYFDEDIQLNGSQESDADKAVRAKKILEAEERRDAVLEACKIFAFDGADAKTYADRFRHSLGEQLKRCDICVREYHRARQLLVQRLEAQFDTDEVVSFMQRFDELNIERVQEGLDHATDILMDMPPAERSINAVGDKGLYALFEALHCVPFLENEEALQKHLDQPFRLVQTKKKLKLPNYAPGMISFMYSRNEARSAWALKNTGGIKRALTENEFEYSVKPFLERALARVHILALEKEFLPGFWRATKHIIAKLDRDMVRNKLRALDCNIYTTALEHFQLDGTHFIDLLTSYQRLIELSPHDFWDALGQITAQAVADTIFVSPTLQRLLKTRDEREPLHLEERMEWTVVLINSIAPPNMVSPVRSILNQLLRHFQKDEYSRYTHTVTFNKGLVCLLTALQRVSAKVKGGALAANMIQVVAKDHLDPILMELSGSEPKNTELAISKNEQLCLDIVEETIKMDLASLHFDLAAILRRDKVEHELQVSGLVIWKRSMALVRPGHPAIAGCILSGLRGLLTFEDITEKQIKEDQNPVPSRAFNEALKRVTGYVTDDLLGRLESFEYDAIFEIVSDPKALEGLVRLLFNGEASVHHGAVNVLKILEDAEDRRGCLMHILTVFYNNTIKSVITAMDDITKARCFTPSPMALKVCTDIFSCLCDSSDGLLRSSKKTDTQPELLELYWTQTWNLVGMMFQQTEAWNNNGRDKSMLQDFCRETMDFADHTFEQYFVIASTIQSATGKSSTAVRTMLLEQPRSKFSVITGWLRLRDDYLISKAIELTVKILGRLKDVDMQVNEQAAGRLEELIIGQTVDGKRVRTKLTTQQKAELNSALENHMGVSFVDTIDLQAPARPKKQSNLNEWASSARSSGASTPVSDGPRAPKPGTIDVEAWAKKEEEKLRGSMTAAEKYRARQQLEPKQKRPGLNSAPIKPVQKPQQGTNEFLAKRQKEKAEAEKARAAALAKSGVGVGSGVVGLGNMGKDHTMKGQTVMVSSDDEDDDDDDDELDADLFGAPERKKKITRPNVDPNGAIGLKPEQKAGPTKIQRTQRSAKDMRARLAPDLSSLHKTILGWDFFHDGDYPPGANEHQFRQVSNSFQDPQTYVQTFQPLLTLEAWQGLVKAREETMSKPYEVKVQTRTNVDSFIEISTIVSHNENRELQLNESDIILLSKSKNVALDSDSPHCLARIYRVKRQKAHCEVVYQILPSTSLSFSLAAQSSVWGLKVQSITPLEREYGALQALQYYDLCNQIIRAKPSKRMNYTEKQLATYQEIWNVNLAQSAAIRAALENEGFSLIQGPPGSGKTKTIVAIVGGLLTEALSGSSNATKISLPKPMGNQYGNDSAPPRKLLVCAPSNAAVDELVMRLKDGITTKNGREHKLNVVRIGRSDAINSQVMDVTMDELVAKRLGGRESDQKQQRNAELFKEHERVSGLLRDLYTQRDKGEIKDKPMADVESEISSLRKRKNELGVRIDNAKDEERNAGREAELNRKRAQQAVLDEAHVICATLSGSGHDMFRGLNIEFETVIIDEAAQCVEMSSLIPLKYGCVKCIMVGDPKQLPPTVFSKEAAKFQYEQSLFVRMQNNHSGEVHLLDTQYRMHPEISVFPSQTFYDGLLKDGKEMLQLRQRPWHASSLLAPYRFFDVAGQHQAAPRGHSLVNVAEIDVAISLYGRLMEDFPAYDYVGKIGIITPYKSQLRMLRERFSSRFGNDIVDKVEFNTTDAFQGRESEIIIFSCVRASPAGGIGFLQDIRRMNVGLTRAKSSLWVLGNSESLVRGQYWKKLVKDAQDRDCYTSGNLRAMLSKQSSSFPARSDVLRSMPDASAHVPQMQPSGMLESGRPPPPPTNGYESTRRSTPDEDRMEGVRYRYQDRVAAKSAKRPDTGSDRSTPQAEAAKPSGAPPQDVEMADADETTRRSITPNAAGPRAETPSARTDQNANPVNGNVETVAGSVSRPVPPVVRKRPAASPFMPPRKHPKPK